MVIFVINVIMVVTNTQPHDIESYLRPGYRILHTIYFQLQAATQDQPQSYYKKHMSSLSTIPICCHGELVTKGSLLSNRNAFWT